MAINELFTPAWPFIKKGLTASLMTIGFLKLFTFRWLNEHREEINICSVYAGVIAGTVLGVVNSLDEYSKIGRANRELSENVAEKIGMKLSCYAGRKVCFLSDALASGKVVASEVVMDTGSFANEKISIYLYTPDKPNKRKGSYFMGGPMNFGG